jgi:aquaporin Z
MAMSRRLAAEFIGTFLLVLAGCGSAVIALTLPGVGIGVLGVALAFGLTVLTMAYAVGHISGGHFNPAVTVGLSLARRFEWRDLLPYVATQVVAAVAASACLLAIAEGKPGYSLDRNGLAANGYGVHSPGHYALGAALLTEVLMTAFFLLVILGATDRRAPKGFGPLAIGLSLTVIHLVSIPVTGTSVNPARSTGPALFVGGWALGQLWLFWVAPLAGAAIAGLVYPFVTGDSGAEPIAESGQDPTTTVTSAGELGSSLPASPTSSGADPPDAGPQ